MTDTALARDVQRVRRLARVLDSAIEIPIIRVRLGADALLGLVPGAGDALSAVLSAYPVIVAARHRLPNAVVTRLVANIVLDTLVGTVPVLGDLFDIGFKANVRNQQLIERYAARPASMTKESRTRIWLIFAGLVVFVAGLLALSIWIVRAAFDAFPR